MIVKVAVPQQFQLKIVPDFKNLFFSNQREVHYIGGSEVLPAPLDAEKEGEAGDGRIRGGQEALDRAQPAPGRVHSKEI